MKNEINVGAIYKIKDGQTLNDIEEKISNLIRVLGYTKDSLNNKYYVEYYFVFKNTFEETTKIHPLKIIDIDLFEKYFEFKIPSNEVNKILFEKYK